MTQPRTEWKLHRWSFDWSTLEETCTRCGLIRIYRRVLMRCVGRNGVRSGVVLDSYTWKGSRLGYALPAPKSCKPLPSGMRRVG